jgi:hypothetical protein
MYGRNGQIWADLRERAYEDVSARKRVGQNTAKDPKDGPHSDMVERRRKLVVELKEGSMAPDSTYSL